MSILRMLPEFAQERLAKARCLGMLGARFIKGTIGTNPRAEWNMNIQVPERSWLFSAVVIRALPHKIGCHRLKATLSIQKLTLLFLCAITPALAQTPPSRPGATPSVVCVAHDPDAISDYRTDTHIVRAMVD